MASPAPASSRHATHNADQMFSPTSAAAWALSTLHTCGAAASSNKCRPYVGTIMGTRLFNGALATSTNKYTTMETVMSSNSFAMSPTEESTDSVTQGTITWGDSQVHHTDVNLFIGPPPPISRSNNLGNNPKMSLTSQNPQSKLLSRFVSKTSFVTPTPKKQKIEDNNGASATSTRGLTEGNTNYSRKNKSLGVLAENFITKFQSYPSGCDIVVDSAAKDLGVERRRIYDVVNILEAIRLVSKEKKNTYKWMGMQDMEKVFGYLQAQAILDYPDDAETFLNISQESSSDGFSSVHRKRLSRKDSKSLAKLSQEFLQVFLVGNETLSLPEASDKIQGAASMEELISIGGGPTLRFDADGLPILEDERERKAAAARGLKTKIRRLYDIANVFMSVGLLRKIEVLATSSSRRPSFSWSYRLDAQQIRRLHVKAVTNNTKAQAGAHVSKAELVFPNTLASLPNNDSTASTNPELKGSSSTGPASDPACTTILV